MLSYVSGDFTRPGGSSVGSGIRVVVNCCNDLGTFRRSFDFAVAWPASRTAYKLWYRGKATLYSTESGPFGLGQVQFVQVGPRIWVANLIGQQGLREPVCYEAIRVGLQKVANFCTGHLASVHLPRTGTALLEGDWTIFEQIVCTELKGLDVTVYAPALS